LTFGAGVLGSSWLALQETRANRFDLEISNAMSWSALAFPDRSTGSWHQTSEMIQEDRKIMEPQRGPGAATKLDQPHRDREGMCAITMLCVCSPTVATLTPCHKIGCKIVHSVQDFHN
jgi:hypothetical protein